MIIIMLDEIIFNANIKVETSNPVSVGIQSVRVHSE
jgi:hypothetical protein